MDEFALFRKEGSNAKGQVEAALQKGVGIFLAINEIELDGERQLLTLAFRGFVKSVVGADGHACLLDVVAVGRNVYAFHDARAGAIDAAGQCFG